MIFNGFRLAAAPGNKLLAALAEGADASVLCKASILAQPLSHCIARDQGMKWLLRS